MSDSSDENDEIALSRLSLASRMGSKNYIKNQISQELEKKLKFDEDASFGISNKKKDEFEALVRSLRLLIIFDYLYLYIGKKENDEYIRKQAASLNYRDLDAVLYHAARGETPQAYLVKLLVTKLHPEISEAYVSRYLGLFEYIGLVRRAPSISGPDNALVVSITPKYHDMATQSSPGAMISTRQAKALEE